MKAPMPKGSAINASRINRWLSTFRFYRAPPAGEDIGAWLNRFAASDRDIAARILDCVEVIPEADIQVGYRTALQSIPGWHRDQREGQWVFTGFGGPGESGMAMLRVFREANNLVAQKYDRLFRSILEIPSLRLSANDTVVLVDDFAGTGRQICNRWPTLTELIACDAACYLVLTAATAAAIARIKEETTLDLIVQHKLQKNDNFFSDSCRHFSAQERAALLPYCRRADNKNPKGFGSCGLLYVLSHKTPNNSLPILHANHGHWRGLFPRFLQPND